MAVYYLVGHSSGIVRYVHCGFEEKLVPRYWNLILRNGDRLRSGC